MLVKDIYRKNPVTLPETATVKEAVNMFIDRHSNGVLVTDKHEKLVGVLSLQDIVRSIVPPDMTEHTYLAEAMYKGGFFEEVTNDIADTPVKNIMRKDFLIAQPETNLMQIAIDFLKNDLYIVPVVENNKLTGVVSRSELKTAFASIFGIERKHE